MENQSQKTSVSESALLRIKKHQQEHLLEVIPLIKDSKQLDDYISTIESIDYEILEQLLPLCFLPNENLPIDPVKNVLSLKNLIPEKRKELYDKGLELISKGQAAVLLMGGGQGSRLGFEHPKGLYNIKMPSQKAIYQIHAEKLLQVMKLAKAKFPQNVQGDERDCITWFIMTSKGKNHDETSEFFVKNNYFGLKKERVIFFPQGALPAIDSKGKVLLEDFNKVFMAPNGNGAVYEALVVNGCLQKMLKEGIKFIHIVGVDNVLAKLCDPLFVGFSCNENKPISCKYVHKKHWQEKVGVHVYKGGKPSIVEYSEISEAQAQETYEHGQLKFFSSNIVNMILSVDFINSIVSNPAKVRELNSKYHVAKKKIKFFDTKTKELITPTEINGFKFELFVFDTYPLAEDFSLLEVIREEEFAPVKNPPGTKEDSPDSARELISQLHQGWLEKLGVKFSKKAASDENSLCEIDSRISYDGENLEEYAKLLKDKLVELPFFLKKE